MKKLLTLFVCALVAFTACNNDDNESKGTNNKNRSFLKCPNENHPHIIDLGLPSGTKWACCNVGATSPEIYGGYYAWGETNEKKVYNEVNYQYCKGNGVDVDGWFYGGDNNYIDIGHDMSGTQYDVAHVLWGNKWQMPTIEQLKELLEICTYEKTFCNSIVCGNFISKTNGGTIFFPTGGYRQDYRLRDEVSQGYYWTGTNHFVLYLDSDTAKFINGSIQARCLGCLVRPVWVP